MTVLALDVGFRHTGWAIVRDGVPFDCGCLHTDKLQHPPESSCFEQDGWACEWLARKLQALAIGYGAKRVVGEMPHGGGQGARAHRCMALASGVAIAALLDYHCTWLPPTRTKAEAEADVREAWPDWEPPAVKRDAEHILDALSCYLQAKKAELIP